VRDDDGVITAMTFLQAHERSPWYGPPPRFARCERKRIHFSSLDRGGRRSYRPQPSAVVALWTAQTPATEAEIRTQSAVRSQSQKSVIRSQRHWPS